MCSHAACWEHNAAINFPVFYDGNGLILRSDYVSYAFEHSVTVSDIRIEM